MLDDVFNSIDENGAVSVFELVVIECPDVAVFVSYVHGNVLPEGGGGDGVVARDDKANEATDESLVLGVVKKVIERI